MGRGARGEVRALAGPSGRGRRRRYPHLQDQRERAELIHLKTGKEVGEATLPDEPPASVGRGQVGFPTPPQARLAALGLPAFGARSLARPGAQDGHCTGSLAVQRTMPQDVEAQAGQLGNESGQRPGQACSEQVLTLFEGEKLRGFGLCRPYQRRGLAFAWALRCGFGTLCPSRPCQPAPFHVRFHNTPKPGSCAPKASARQRSLDSVALQETKTVQHKSLAKASSNFPAGGMLGGCRKP